ncbi:MAG: tautomerase family protein [Pontimonas sp.]|jgi:4-oxalocrotonate tautomerase|nr:tautomerase family protein [Pontimonas sp.]MCF8547856.1 tautomerase family protein [Pontimonas sp.]
MPYIQISLAEGRTEKQIRDLIHGVTELAVSVAGAPREAVSVIVTEVPTTRWSTGDVTVAEKRSTQEKS